MKQVLWEIKFKVKDKRIYGKGKSVIANVNVTVPTQVAIYVLQGIYNEAAKLNAEQSSSSELKDGNKQ